MHQYHFLLVPLSQLYQTYLGLVHITSIFASSLGTDKIDSLGHITTLRPSGSSGLGGSEANLSFSNVGSATDSLSTFYNYL
jgi:hypothetical protein